MHQIIKGLYYWKSRKNDLWWFMVIYEFIHYSMIQNSVAQGVTYSQNIQNALKISIQQCQSGTFQHHAASCSNSYNKSFYHLPTSPKHIYEQWPVLQMDSFSEMMSILSCNIIHNKVLTREKFTAAGSRSTP